MDGFVKLVKLGIYAGCLYAAYHVGFSKGYDKGHDDMQQKFVAAVRQEKSGALSRLENVAKHQYETMRSVVQDEMQRPVKIKKDGKNVAVLVQDLLD